MEIGNHITPYINAFRSIEEASAGCPWCNGIRDPSCISCNEVARALKLAIVKELLLIEGAKNETE